MKKSGPNEKEIKQRWQDYRWLMWALGVLFVICLGYSGFREYFLSKYEAYSPLDIFYRTLQLFVLDSGSLRPPINLKLELARWLAPAISVIAAANVLIAIFREQFQLFKIRSLGKHIIVCGLGNKGLLLSLKFKDYGKKLVVIELNEENDNIIECRNKGIIVLTGNAKVPNILSRAGLKKAAYLFSVCGQDNINAEIAFQARELLKDKKSKPLTCIVHITDPQLSRLIKEREFETEKNNAFRLEFLDLFDRAAKTLINSFNPFIEKKEYQTLPPHILLVGAGSIGESLVVHAAKEWEKLTDNAHKKFKISIIDKSAKQNKDFFYLRYPQLDKICQLIPLEIDIKSPEFESGRFLFNENKECIFTTIYLCLNDDSFALSKALLLHQRLRKYDIPIIVQMNSEAGLAELIQGESHGLGRLHGFGLLDRVLDPKILLMGTHEILAQAIHEEYLKDQLSKGKTLESNSSLVPWDKLPETLKESNRRQADFLGVKLKEVGCYIVPITGWNVDPIEFFPEEIELMAKMEHDHWVEERLKDGWKYAPGPKNDKKRKSPSLVPWDELIEEEKEKDRNPVRKIPDFLLKAGFQIYRREKHE
ncbi:MAG: RyR domain-containing protein [Candidatus Aminicenantes bacterium]